MTEGCRDMRTLPATAGVEEDEGVVDKGVPVPKLSRAAGVRCCCNTVTALAVDGVLFLLCTVEESGGEDGAGEGGEGEAGGARVRILILREGGARGG